MNQTDQFYRGFLILLAVLASIYATANNTAELGRYTAHYSVVNSTFLQPEIATSYNIKRAPNRAVISITFADESGSFHQPKVSAAFINLLSQKTPLNFQKHSVDESHYYIASLNHTDGERLKFEITVRFEDGYEGKFEFSQQLFVQ